MKGKFIVAVVSILIIGWIGSLFFGGRTEQDQQGSDRQQAKSASVKGTSNPRSFSPDLLTIEQQNKFRAFRSSDSRPMYRLAADLVSVFDKELLSHHEQTTNLETTRIPLTEADVVELLGDPTGRQQTKDHTMLFYELNPEDSPLVDSASLLVILKDNVVCDVGIAQEG